MTKMKQLNYKLELLKKEKFSTFDYLLYTLGLICIWISTLVLTMAILNPQEDLTLAFFAIINGYLIFKVLGNHLFNKHWELIEDKLGKIV